MIRTFAGAFMSVAMLLFASNSSSAHHHFANYSEEQIVLRGTVADVFIENPHGILTIKVGDVEWDAFLGSVRRSKEIGLSEEMFHAGDPIVIYGHPSVVQENHELMTLQILYRGKRYEVFHDINDIGAR